MKQLFTSAKETVALTRNAGSISLFAGATLGLAGTIVLNARDAATIASELMVAAIDLDEDVALEVMHEYGESLRATADGERREKEREFENGPNNLGDESAPRPLDHDGEPKPVAAIDVQATQIAVSFTPDSSQEDRDAIVAALEATGAKVQIFAIDTLSSLSDDQAPKRDAAEAAQDVMDGIDDKALKALDRDLAAELDNKPASGQDGQTSSDKVSLQATSETGKTEDQTKAVGEALSQETKPASSEAPKPAARRGRKPKASA